MSRSKRSNQAQVLADLIPDKPPLQSPLDQSLDSDKSERSFWAALAHDPRFGARHFQQLLALNVPLAELWLTSRDELMQRGLGGDQVALFDEIRKAADPETVLGELSLKGITFVTVRDQVYPRLLREISVPPAVLYVRGQLSEHPRLSVVGTRSMSAYGQRVTDDLVERLASTGLTIVSGLALGIDGRAHDAAIRSGGITWAVLPGGVDVPYPASHQQLADQILLTGGALLSEFPPGTEALRHHFPIRNRIIAGLASATLVIEASEKSGTLLTARSALEANRDVFVVPGSIYAPGSVGPHRLIQMGAKLVHTAEDVLQELGMDQAVEERTSRTVLPDSAEERLILEALGAEPVLADDLIASLPLDAGAVLSTLTLMEMKGRIRNLGGNQFVRR